MTIKNAKNKPVSQEKTLPVRERWYVQAPGGKPRLMTDNDEAVDGLIYHKLARKTSSFGKPEMVAGVCAITGKKFLLWAMPQKQADNSWAVVAKVHPVIMRQQMIRAEAKALALDSMAQDFGDEAAALWGKKVAA
jgi:hypothetical protein